MLDIMNALFFFVWSPFMYHLLCIQLKNTTYSLNMSMNAFEAQHKRESFFLLFLEHNEFHCSTLTFCLWLKVSFFPGVVALSAVPHCYQNSFIFPLHDCLCDRTLMDSNHEGIVHWRVLYLLRVQKRKMATSCLENI